MENQSIYSHINLHQLYHAQAVNICKMKFWYKLYAYTNIYIPHISPPHGNMRYNWEVGERIV